MANVKIYKARSEVSLCAVLSEGRTMHISFDSLTGGGSIYRTSDEEIQKALESHHKFNKLFRLVEEVKSESADKKKGKKSVLPYKEKALSGEAEPGSQDEDMDSQDEDLDDVDETTDGPDNESRVVKVSDLSDAKEYLADTFGVPRTSLRSKVKIMEAAEEHGICFEGLD